MMRALNKIACGPQLLEANISMVHSLFLVLICPSQVVIFGVEYVALGRCFFKIFAGELRMESWLIFG